MQRLVKLGAAAFLAADVLAAGGLDFRYTLEQERGGLISDSSFLMGFEGQEGRRLRVKLEQPAYCYIIASDGEGNFTLTFPSPQDQQAGPLSQARAKLPATTFVRLEDDPDVERLFLIVASERIPELERSLEMGDTQMPEAVALKVRDRYQGEGSYRRDLIDNVAKVSWKPRGNRPAVVVEEISMRRR